MRKREGHNRMLITVIPHDRARFAFNRNDHIGRLFHFHRCRCIAHHPRTLEFRARKLMLARAPTFKRRSDQPRAGALQLHMKRRESSVGGNAQRSLASVNSSRDRDRVLSEGHALHKRSHFQRRIARNAHASKFEQSLGLTERIGVREQQHKIAVAFNPHIRTKRPITNRHGTCGSFTNRSPDDVVGCEFIARTIRLKISVRDTRHNARGE